MTEINPRTGEPRRPWSIRLATLFFFAAAALVGVALLQAMWRSVDRFAEAAWLNQVVPTELGDPVRLLLVLGVWASAVTIGTVATITGYYAWAGYRWARWSGFVAVAVGGLSFLINPLAWWCLGPLGLGAALLWLPASRRFFACWHEVRHPEPHQRISAGPIQYGPLPRYAGENPRE